jgi:hypothetical protein
LFTCCRPADGWSSRPGLDSPKSLHEHSRHALIEARLLAGDRLAKEGDGHKDFPGRHVGAHVPAVYRSGEERLERRFDPVQKMLWEVIVGRVTGVQRRGEPAFGADEVREALDPAHERFPRTERGPELLRSLERFRTEQPPYSILHRGIEREVLPVAQRCGMGILAWGPLGQGMLTGRVRRGQANDVLRARFFSAFSDGRRLDAVERLIPLAEEAGLSMPHLAMAFAISHPGVTTALLGTRTMEQFDDLLAGVDVVLSDDVLDRIDEIVPPGTDIGTLDQAYVPPLSGRPSYAAAPSATAPPPERARR